MGRPGAPSDEGVVQGLMKCMKVHAVFIDGCCVASVISTLGNKLF